MSRTLKETGPLTALGTMSGTSLDGVDAAILQSDGQRFFFTGPSLYRAYSAEEQAILRAALGHWSGEAVVAAEAVVEAAHLSLLRDMLATHGPVDLIGFHGQTLAHAPRGWGTLQAGCGTRLAEALGVPVVWDFRTMDVEAGGEGAPLAPFFHFACAKFIQARDPVGFLNLGGVGNLTFVDPSAERPEVPGALLSFDTGPANAPINDLLQSRLGLGFDEGGRLARQGAVNSHAVAAVLSDPYFSRKPPKSLDRNAFVRALDAVSTLSDADAAATLTAICAETVAAGMRFLPGTPSQVLVTGGGRHNLLLMEMLGRALSCPVQPVEDVGLDGDMLEAQAFAHLAVRVVRGLPTSAPGTTGARGPICGGRLSQPEYRSRAAQA